MDGSQDRAITIAELIGNDVNASHGYPAACWPSGGCRGAPWGTTIP